MKRLHNSTAIFYLGYRTHSIFKSKASYVECKLGQVHEDLKDRCSFLLDIFYAQKIRFSEFYLLFDFACINSAENFNY